MFDEPDSDARLLARIAVDADVCAGKPRVRGTRIWVGLILGMLAHGKSLEALLEEYPHLDADDVSACLAYGRDVGQRAIGRSADRPPAR
jgi:uncharacterized protein (DUF433 family)